MSSPPWSELPEELLTAIAKRLNGQPEILRFRAVCKSWRSSIACKESPMFPSKLPFPISRNDPIHPMRKGFFTLSHTSTYLIQPLEQTPPGAPFQSLLIRVRSSGKSGKMCILNPFSRQKPIGFSPKTFPKVLNLLDYNVIELNRTYSMKFNERSKNKAPPMNIRFRVATPQEKKEAAAIRVERVVISRSSDGRDGVIFGIYNAGNLFIMRGGDKKWTVLDDDAISNSEFQDVAIHRGKCYAVDNSGKVVVLTSSLQVLELIPSPIPATLPRAQKYLVESYGDLFFIHGELDPFPEDEYWRQCFRYDMETKSYFRSFYDDGSSLKLQFRVYKLNKRRRVWEEVESLEDRAFFAGEDCRFCVLAQNSAGCQGNRLYYYQQGFGHWRVEETRYNYIPGLRCGDIGVCDLKDGYGVPLDCFPDDYADIIWPPPPWLRPILPSDHQDSDDEDQPTHPSDLSFLSLEP